MSDLVTSSEGEEEMEASSQSAEQNGGCTGEPQQYKNASDYKKNEERRLLGIGSGILP